MTKNRVIYNNLGVFAGPAPATGYHFIDFGGGMSNNSAINLLQPIHRVQSFSYSVVTSQDRIVEIGKSSNENRYKFSNPEITVNFEYLINGVGNENKLGFYTNFYNEIIGQANYSNNQGVYFLSGLTTRNNTYTDNEFHWPLEYRDCRNLFVAVSREGYDFKKQYWGRVYPDPTSIDVYGFGNCYATNYSFNYSVGSFPKANLSYLAHNICYYNSGENQKIPAIDVKNGKPIEDVLFNMRSSYQDDGYPSVLRPGDMKISISGQNSENFGSIKDNTKEFQQNLLKYSEDLTRSDWVSSAPIISFSSGLSPFNYTGISRLSNAGFIYQLTEAAPSNSEMVLSAWVKSVSSATGIGFRIDRNSIAQGNEKNYPITSDWTRIIHTGKLDTNNNTQVASRFDYVNGDLYIYGAQLHYSGYSNNYIGTTDSSVNQNSGALNPNNLGFQFADLKLQSFNTTIPLSRQPVKSFGYKYPVDYKVLEPIIATANITFIVGASETGSIYNLLRENNNYNFDIKIAQPNFLPYNAISVSSPLQTSGSNYRFRNNTIFELKSDSDSLFYPLSGQNYLGEDVLDLLAGNTNSTNSTFVTTSGLNYRFKNNNNFQVGFESGQYHQLQLTTYNGEQVLSISAYDSGVSTSGTVLNYGQNYWFTNGNNFKVRSDNGLYYPIYVTNYLGQDVLAIGNDSSQIGPETNLISGNAIYYSIKGAKLTNISYSHTIGEAAMLGNASFEIEMSSKNLNKGLFMSGQLNYANSTSQYGYLQQDDLNYILQDNNDRFIVNRQLVPLF